MLAEAWVKRRAVRWLTESEKAPTHEQKLLKRLLCQVTAECLMAP